MLSDVSTVPILNKSLITITCIIGCYIENILNNGRFSYIYYKILYTRLRHFQHLYSCSKSQKPVFSFANG